MLEADGFAVKADPLKALLDLNRSLALNGAKDGIVGPGLPTGVKQPEKLISRDRYSIPV